MNFNKKLNLGNKLKLATLIGSLCTGSISAQVVSAESAEESAESAEGLEVILVTAGKRGATRVQDIPVSISAVSEDQISKRGLVGMDDYLRSTPSTNFLDRGAGRNGIIIRGVTASPQTDSTVGIYIDETPLTGLGSSSPGSGGNPDLKFVDMQRIEVLRGPQGTLYGDGSISGTVRAIPNAPDLNYFSAKISGSFSSTADKGGDNTSLRGVVNLPVVDDTFAVRIVAYDYDNSGYYESVSGSNADKQIWADAFGGITSDKDDVGSDEYTGSRITALWQVTDNIDATLTYMTQDIEQSGIPESFLNLGGTRRAPFQRLDGSDEALAIDLDVSNLKMNWDLGSFILTSSTSKAETSTLQDRDIGLFFGPLIDPGIGDMPLFLKDSGSVDSFTQEVRLNTQLDGPWQFLLGAFYQDVESKQEQHLTFDGDPALDLFAGDLLFKANNNEDLEQLAFFGEVSFDLTEQLTAVAGVRHFDYDKKATETADGVFNGGPSQTSLENDDSGQTYKFGLTYLHNKTATYYATYAQGFRLGGPHPDVPSDICDLDGNGLIDGVDVALPDQIASDELDSFELGAKFSLADGRATLNVAAYRVEWDGIPVALTADCGFGVTINAGEAQSQGLEVEGQVLLSDMWTLNYGLSYVNAELTNDAPGLGSSGERLPGSPETQASLGLQVDFEVAGRPIFARADAAYIGEYYNNLQEQGLNAGDYTTVNLSIGVEINDHISLDFFARNLSGEEGLTWVETEIGDGRANFIRPRTIGMEFRARFD
jgi:outer membrane receptor protein involved in Fe transport